MKDYFQGITITIDSLPHIMIINNDTENHEPSVNIWRYDVHRMEFYVMQTIYVVQPNSVTATQFHGSYYMAISSGHITNAVPEEMVEIRK